MIKNIFKTERPKLLGIYRGVVVDVDDPNKQGRVRLRIYGVMNSQVIDTQCLPWAAPANPLICGAGSTIEGENRIQWGSFTVPEVGSRVWVFFENGSHMCPVYFAEAVDGISGNFSEFTDDNYPNRKGFRLPNGILVYYDVDADVMYWEHPTGTYRKVTAEGDIVIYSVRNIEETVGQDILRIVGRDVIESIVRNMVKTVDGDLDYDVLGYASLEDKHDEKLCQTGFGPVPTFLSVAPSGWLLLDGKTIGNVFSGATYRGDKYEDLFNVLKGVYPNTGSEDYESGDQVILPDMRGRIAMGMDNMGGSAANLVTNANADILGGRFGEEYHQLTIAELARHQHAAWGDTFTGVWPYGEFSSGQFGSGSSDNDNRLYGTSFAGNDEPHNNMQPTVAVNMMVKY